MTSVSPEPEADKARTHRHEMAIALLKRHLASIKREQSLGVGIDPKMGKDLEKEIARLEKELE